MGKGAAKFGGKSGILPSVRQVFKHPTKPVVRPANPNVGYAEGIQHPRGTSREQPEPKVRSVSDLIRDTVKDPQAVPDLQKADAIQKEKVYKATLRRQYYAESLHKEEKKIASEAEKTQKRLAAEAKKKAETKYEMSQATKLTLPTISNLLEGPLMRERTEEEKQLLEAKRRANRLQNELKTREARAVDLLSLYYAAENFIMTEAELKHAVEKEFEVKSDHSFHNVEDLPRSKNQSLRDALFGTINDKPGLQDVEDELTGAAKEFRDRVNALAAEAVEKKMKEELPGAQ